MAKVRDILAQKKIKHIISVTPTTTVIDALKIMAEKNIGAVVVMENDKLVGIFSERDYARKGIVQGRKAKSTAMSEVMTPKVFTVEPDMTVRDCMQIMSDRHFRHLPVLDEGKVVGLLSVGDIVTNLITEQRQHINFLESYISS
ncbi:MAG: CBS domain-containing protein [Spirosomaceae bacterium]|nr:CBS domain-containing protein [Spirosomataceae bacterium]